MWGFILAIASAVFQHKRQKKAQKQAEREADKRKGFMLTVEGQPIYLPIVYGYQKVGGVRTLHKTRTGGVLQPNSPQFTRYLMVGKGISAESKIIMDSNGGFITSMVKKLGTLSGGKNSTLLVQQALCFGNIHSIVDLEVDGLSWDDPDQKFSHCIEASLTGGVANPTATGLGAPATNTFTNTAYLSSVFYLDRDNPQYNGVPEVSAYVKGSLIYDLVASGSNVSLSSSKIFSNNSALVLLDYLTRPATQGGCGYSISDIDLGSFYRAKLYCNIVTAANIRVKGRINGVRPVKEGETPNVVRRDVRLYEANLTIDTEKPRRDNIERILDTMNQADLIWSEGKYKLVLEYPNNASEQEALITGSYTDADIINENITVSWSGAGDRINRAVVEFFNEEENFTQDSVSWPVRGSATHTSYMNQDRNIPAEDKYFLHGATHRKSALAKAEELVRYSRQGKEVSLTLSRNALKHEVGDLIKVNSEIGKLTNEALKIEEININEDLTVSLKCSAFSWDTLAYNVDDDYVAPDKYYINSEIPNVGSLTYHSGSRTGAKSAGWLTWTHPEDTHIEEYRIYARQLNDDYILVGRTQKSYFDIPQEYNKGDDYYFMVITVSDREKQSSGAIILVDNLPAIIPVTDLRAESSVNTITLYWTDPSADLVQGYQVFRSNTNIRANAEVLGSASNPVYVYAPAPKRGHYFWVESRGLRGEVATAGPLFVSGGDLGVEKLFEDAGIKATRDITSRDVAGAYVGELAWSRADNRLYRWNGTTWVHFIQESVQGILDETAFAQNIRVPKLVNALPTTGQRVGDMVVQQSEPSKIYTWNGTAWVAEVAADQIVGKLTATQIGAAAVGAEQLAANAASISKLVVADFSNLVLNNWINGDLDGWATNGTVVIQNRADTLFVNQGISGNMAVYSGGDSWLRSPKTLVSKGEEYFCEIYIRRSSSAPPDGTALVQIRWTLADGSATYTTIGTTSDVATINLSKIVTTPDNAIDASLWIRPNVGGTTGTVFLARPVMRRANNGKLTVDGTIKGTHIEYETLTGGLMPPTGIITKSGQIDDAVIKNAHIQDATLTRVKIGANQLYVPYYWAPSNSVTITSTYNYQNPRLLIERTIPDFEGGGYIVAFNCFVRGWDAFGTMYLELDGDPKTKQRFGVRASGGSDATYLIPVNTIAQASGTGTTNIKVYAYNSHWNSDTQTANDYTIQNMRLTLSGTRR